MFNSLVIWYLFLGGAGGGTCLVYLFVKFVANRVEHSWRAFFKIISGPALILSFAFIATGSICLLGDLTRPGKTYLLFTNPTFSALTIGGYSVLLLMACLFFLLTQRFLCLKRVGPGVTRGIEIATAVLSAIVIIYTGVFLSSIGAVGLWRTSFLSVLFTLSSLSCGIAVVFVIAAFMETRIRQVYFPLRALTRIDLALILLEAGTVATIYLTLADVATVAESFASLASGVYSKYFWVGFAGCGLIIPLVMETLLTPLFKRRPSFYLCVGCLVLIGGYFLRFFVVNAGIHLSTMIFIGL